MKIVLYVRAAVRAHSWLYLLWLVILLQRGYITTLADGENFLRNLSLILSPFGDNWIVAADKFVKTLEE